MSPPPHHDGQSRTVKAWVRESLQGGESKLLPEYDRDAHREPRGHEQREGLLHRRLKSEEGG